MRSRWRHSVRFRHAVWLSVVIVLIMGAGAGLLIYKTATMIHQSAEDRGLALARAFAVTGATAVLNNLFVIQESIQKSFQDPHVLHIDVIDRDNMIIASKHVKRIGSLIESDEWLGRVQPNEEVVAYREDVDGQPILVIVEPLFAKRQLTAWLRVVMSLAHVRQEIWHTVGQVLAVTLALIAAGMVGVHVVQRHVSNVLQILIGQLNGALAALGAAPDAPASAPSREAASPEARPSGRGEIEYLTDVASQATELVRTQSEALRQSELKFRSVTQSANDAIVSVDVEGRIISWNRGARAIFGYQDDEIIGKPVTTLMPEQYRELCEGGQRRVREAEKPHLIGSTRELHGLRKDGTTFPLELSLSGWEAAGQRFFTAIIRDITERKRAEQELEALTVSLEQKVQARTAELETARDQALMATRHKSDFLANMSHELRTPLNAVIGFSEVLLERMFGDLNNKQEEYLQDIYSSGRHLLALINDILDLSKIEAGRIELELSVFHLPSTIESAIAFVRERAVRHRITLTTEIDTQLGECHADERKVKQVLLNLLSNAIKFTPDGGVVRVTARLAEAAAEMSVTDTGVGIPPEDQQKVFEEFYRAKADHMNKREGTGLGLSLAKKFVELHGGSISVTSTVGKGSTFTFTIPLAAILTQAAGQTPTGSGYRDTNESHGDG